MSTLFAQDLSEEQVQQFTEFLHSYEDAHSYAGAHGFISALCVIPNNLTKQDWLTAILDEEPQFESEEEAEEIYKSMDQLAGYIDANLSASESTRLPVGPYIVEKGVSPEMEDWCIGFMDAVFMDEENWYEDNEELVTELLLPMAALSDVFDDKELRQLVSNPKKAKQICEQVPQVLIDLYLLFRQE